MARIAPIVCLLLVAGCSVSTTLEVESSSQAAAQARDADPEVLGQGEPSSELGNLRLEPGACSGIDLTTSYAPTTLATLTAFLESVGAQVTVENLRGDLTVVRVKIGESRSALRVAILATPQDAARHLHSALLEHGRDYWGVHRSNVAVLGSPGEVDQIVAFAVQSKLACWGELTIAGRDDDYVVPGGYIEL